MTQSPIDRHALVRLLRTDLLLSEIAEHLNTNTHTLTGYVRRHHLANLSERRRFIQRQRSLAGPKAP